MTFTPQRDVFFLCRRRLIQFRHAAFCPPALDDNLLRGAQSFVLCTQLRSPPGRRDV